MIHRSVQEPFPNFPTTTASVAWTGPEYQALHCSHASPGLEEPFRVLWGRVDFLLSQGRGSSRPGPAVEGQRAGVCVCNSDRSPPCSQGCGWPLPCRTWVPAGVMGGRGPSGVVYGFSLGACGRRWAASQRQGPAKVPPRMQLVPTRPHCVLAAPRLGDPAAQRVLPFVTSFFSLAVVFLEGHFGPFIPASFPGISTVFSHVLACALWGLAKGGMSAASIGHWPRAAR